MIDTSSLPATLALKLVNSKRDVFENGIRKDVVNAREIKSFEERIASITSVDDLVKDYEVYSFVMKAHDLEDQIFGRAMMKKVLVAETSDRTSLVNRLTDKRFLEIRKTLGFDAEGKAPDSFSDPDWRAEMVQKYVDQKLIVSQLESNEAVGLTLHFEKKAESIKSWYNVLADTRLQELFYTAFGLPDSLRAVDVDAQVKVLEKRFDIEKLQDPEERDKLIRRFTAMSVATADTSGSSNPIVQLVSGGNSSSGSIIGINLSGLTALKAGKYSG